MKVYLSNKVHTCLFKAIEPGGVITRVNVYAEELTERCELVHKTTEDGDFTGIRFYLELPISVPAGSGHRITHRGPFIHKPGDDDSSAVTFWGKQDFRKVLRTALDLLDKHYSQR